MKHTILTFIISLLLVNCKAQDVKEFDKESTFVAIKMDSEIEEIKCKSCQLFFYKDVFFIYTSFSGDLPASKFQIEIKSKSNDSLNIEMILPKYKNLYFDILPFKNGDHYLGVGGKEFNKNNFKSIKLEYLLEVLKKNKVEKLGDYELVDLEQILLKEYNVINLSTAGVEYKPKK
ncbi:hypothetical protein [uncultured Aquimarina sp.]|uniref:hypothetical protein n=1 Tax=uncultured Aquimarina sp. TaxID=575652 RepID=UPI002602940B|nr:hypothetical protein [uncultured Aquimarina sp.]